jgi:hypothetical protein
MSTSSLPGVIAVEVSQNAKIGLAGATYAAQASCPRTCRFLGNGCYAEEGHTSLITRRLNEEAAQQALTDQAIAENEADLLAGMRGLLDLRLHVVGDCRTREAARRVACGAERYASRVGRRVWTYTHAEDVRRDDWGGVSVLASCESGSGVRRALRRGFVPALVVKRAPDHLVTAGGVRFVLCPYQTKQLDCTRCRLCLDDASLRQRGLGIALHGSKRKSLQLPRVKLQAQLSLILPQNGEGRREPEAPAAGA